MAIFRTDDYVSMQFVFLAIFSASMLLLIAYFLLRFYKNEMLKKSTDKIKDTINVLESKYIPNLGHLFLISVDEKNFLVLNSKFGMKLVQITEENYFSGMEDKR